MATEGSTNYGGSSRVDSEQTTTALRQWLLGQQACGCVTLVLCRPDEITRDDEKAISKIITSGGQVLRATEQEARALPHFLPSECPHDPKGWEPWEPKPFEPRVRWKQTYRRVDGQNVRRVYVTTPWHHEWGGGDAVKRDGKWWAMKGWFNSDGRGANDGREPRRPVEIVGPFDTQREVGEWHATEAMKDSRAAWLRHPNSTEEAADRLAVMFQ